jgi:quinol monooxygenase YgiN
VTALYRIAELEIVSESVADYAAFLKEEIEASLRLEPGVLFLVAVAVKERPSVVRVFEGYASQAAYEAHLKTPHFLKYKLGTADMVRSLKLIEVDPIAMAGHLA